MVSRRRTIVLSIALPRAAPLLTLLLALLLPGAAHAAEVVNLTPGTERVVLGRHLGVLEDPGGALTIEQVSAPAFTGRFTPSKGDAPNFGFTGSAVWVTFELKETSGRSDWLLEVGYPLLDRITLYVEQPDGSYLRREGGDRLPFSHRQVADLNEVFILSLPRREHTTRVFVRVTTGSGMQIPLTLWSRTAFHGERQLRRVLLGVYYGLMLAMLLYNLFIYFSIRDKRYIFYCVYIGCFIIWQFVQTGLVSAYLLPDAVWWCNCAAPFTTGLVVAAAAAFGRRFLDTRQDHPRLDKLLLGIGIIAMLGAALSFVLPYPIAMQAEVATSHAVALALIGSSAWAFYKGHRAARFFLLAWTFLILGVLVLVFKTYGILPPNMLTDHAVQIGSVAEVILLSFALADRINILKAEKEEAQERALQLQREATLTLQAEVDRQTEELRHTNAALRKLDKQKTVFFQNISHELRTPLTVLLVPLGRLAKGKYGQLPGEATDRLRLIERNAHRLLRLVNQLLDLARLDAGEFTVAWERRDIVKLVEPVIDGFQPLARSKGVQLELRHTHGADLPPVYIDPQMLDTVVVNLVSNACKFTSDGGSIIVGLGVDPAGGEGEGRFLIKVKDTGAGIAAADQRRIFERFGQAEPSRTRRGEGTGIGLALARELVQQMGGTLDLESEVGMGSTFSVSLRLGTAHVQERPDAPSVEAGADAAVEEEVPTAQQEASALRARLEAAHAAGHEPGEVKPPEPAASADERPLVVVVEDNRDMRGLLAEVLREDFRVLEAADGALGLQIIEEQLPELVVSDVMMPEMDGHQLMEALRAGPETAGIPVMLITAQAGAERRLASLQRGADDYLTKPFDPRELQARARNLVRMRTQERELRTLSNRLQREVVEQAGQIERARALGRYLPPAVVRSVMDETQPLEVAHERRPITLFWMELRGFDRVVRKVEPEDLAALLNSYLSEATDVAFAYGATIDKFVRDSVIGFFGAPSSKGKAGDAARCAEMAAEMWRRIDGALRERWRSVVSKPLPAPTLVVHSGFASVGSFGSPRRLDYTAVGAVVDQARALLDALASGQAVCSPATWSLIEQVWVGEQGFGFGDPDLVTLSVGGASQACRRLAGAPAASGDPSGELDLDAMEETASQAPQLPADGWYDVGQRLAQRYEIIERLGRGAIGAVYRVKDLKLEDEVAVKTVRPEVASDKRAVEVLYKEVRMARLVTHVNIARVYDIVEWAGGHLITMEYIAGQTLAMRLRRGPLPVEEARAVTRQLCLGLAAAHVAGVVHRDLKPQNIMLEKGGRVAILDFGLAREFTSNSSTREFRGTPAYMAPEQVAGGSVDGRADLYALGAVMFEMLTGERPFSADSVISLAYKQINEPPPDPLAICPDLSPRLAAIITRCLAKEPDQRFADASRICDLLDADVE